MLHRNRIALGVSATMLTMSLLAVDQIAAAQQALEEIVVTARKREESLQEIPIAITAFSADQIERAGYKNLQELSGSVPGLQYSTLGLNVPGRAQSNIRFRGMDTNSLGPTFALGTLFVDGIFVLGNTESIPFDDVERVEVVKGPQAAYFGRNTFAGAINYIMKTPSLTEYSGEVKASGATYDEYNVSASFDGPIIEDKLGIRIGGRLYDKGNMYTATDGGGLGEESSRSGQVTLFGQLTDQLHVRVRGFYARDEDGPAAAGYIPGRLNDTCSGLTITTKAGETARPVRWICGQVPKQGTAVNALGSLKIIDSNTTARSPQAFLSTGDPDFLLKNVIQKPQNPLLAGVPTVEGIEMERTMSRVSGNLEYEFANGITAVAQGGLNKQQINWVRDYNYTPRDNAYSRDPQDLEDYSLEARVLSDQEQRLTWLAGVNFYNQDFVSSLTGGDSLFVCIDTVPGLPIGACRPNPAPAQSPASTFMSNNAAASTDHVETLGVFAAVAYDFTDELSLNLEGRYQKDDFTRAGVTVTSKKFLPRVIAQYQPSSETNVYLSFARGTLPGEANAPYIQSPSAQSRAQLEANNVFETVPAEILDSYELGWKQQYLDNRVSTNIAAYYGEWKNKKSRLNVPIQLLCGEFNLPPTAIGCRGPAFGEASAGQPARTATGPFTSTITASVAGQSKIWGVEFESQAAITEKWSGGLSVDYSGNKFVQLFANVIQSYAGFTNVKGNKHPRFPKWSGAVNTTFQDRLNDDWEWFVRGDLSYFGKTFVDLDNLATCDSYFLANARAGVMKENFDIEFFVKNIFDDTNWNTCTRFSEFDLPMDTSSLTLYNGILVIPQNKRQFGVRTSLRF
jgi:iron complex outermembrane receptor protein